MFILLPRLRMRVSVLALPAFLLLLWLEGVVPLAIMMLSATAHEAGHILAIKLLGYRVRRIDILPMGALIVVPEGIPDKSEAVIALAGPITSLALAVLSMAWFAVSGTADPLFAVLINLVFGTINLLPIQKLDGGKALYCILSHKQKSTAKQICSAVSLCAKIIFVTICVLFAVFTQFNLGVILMSLSLICQII